MNESRRQLFHTKAKMRQVWPIILFLWNLKRYLPTKLSGSAAAVRCCDLNVLVRGFVISHVAAFLRAKPERRLNWTGRTANSKKASRIGRKVDPAVQILWNNYGGGKHYKLCKYLWILMYVLVEGGMGKLDPRELIKLDSWKWIKLDHFF